MSDLPSPLVPIVVDLRDFGYMPLDVLRLRDSDLAALATGDQFKAAVMLWCVAWHQVPAASLPNDDRLLARYSGAGAAWKKVKETALRGFVKCSDGRLYHRTIAEKALDSWESKRAQRNRTKAATLARQESRRLQQIARDDQRDVARDEGRDDKRDVNRDEQREENRYVHQGKLREGKGSKEDQSQNQIVATEATSGAREHRGDDFAVNGFESHGPPSETPPPPTEPPPLAVAMVSELRNAGMAVNAMNSTVLAWVKDGFTIPQVVESFAVARVYKPEPEPIPPNYLDRILRDPPKKKSSSNGWRTSDAGIDAKGRELGVRPKGGESYPEFAARIQAEIDSRKVVA